MKKIKTIVPIMLVLITLLSILLVPANAKTFSDVRSGQWYTEGVYWAEQHKLINGYPDGTFRPNKTISRAEFSQILYAAALNIQNFIPGLNEADEYRIVGNKTKIRWIGDSYGGNGASGNVCYQYASVLKNDMDTLSKKSSIYTDVKNGDWYADAVRWCYHKGLYTNMFTDSTKFYPNTVITREQAMTMLYRWWFAITQIYKNDYVQWTWPWQQFDRIRNDCRKVTDYKTDDRNPDSDPKYLYWGLARNESTYNIKKQAVYTVFVDANQISSWAVPAMVWAANSAELKAKTGNSFSWGFLSGTGDYMLAPKGSLTRAQVVTIMYRIFKDLAPKKAALWSLD